MLADATGVSSNSAEAFPPLGAELGVEDAVHPVRGQRGSVLLELRQRLAIGFAELFGNGRLHDGKRLSDLHGTALELAEHLEELVGGLLHHLRVDFVLGRSGQPLAEAQRRTARDADGQARQLHVACGAAALDVCHQPIIHDEAGALTVSSRIVDVSTTAYSASHPC